MLVKDYDCLILYHPNKVNVVIDTLSCKSISSLPYLVSKEKKLICLYPKFEMLGVQLENMDQTLILAHMMIQLVMVDHVKKA